MAKFQENLKKFGLVRRGIAAIIASKLSKYFEKKGWARTDQDKSAITRFVKLMILNFLELELGQELVKEKEYDFSKKEFNSTKEKPKLWQHLKKIRENRQEKRRQRKNRRSRTH